MQTPSDVLQATTRHEPITLVLIPTETQAQICLRLRSTSGVGNACIADAGWQYRLVLPARTAGAVASVVLQKTVKAYHKVKKRLKTKLFCAQETNCAAGNELFHVWNGGYENDRPFRVEYANYLLSATNPPRYTHNVFCKKQ